MGRSAKSLQILKNVRARPPTQLYLPSQIQPQFKILKDIRMSGPGSYCYSAGSWIQPHQLWKITRLEVILNNEVYFSFFLFSIVEFQKDIRHWLSSCCSAGSQIQPHQLGAVSPWFYHQATNWGISGGYAWNIAQLRELCQFCIFFTSFSPGFGLNIDYRHKKLFVLKKKSLRGKSWYEFTKP